MKIINGISSVSLQSTRYLSDALRELGHESDIVVYRGNRLLIGYEDINLDLNMKNYFKYPRYIVRILRFFFHCIKKYDVFHFHFGHSLLPKNIDLWLLRKLNKKVYMEYHGSELRRKSVYEAKNVYNKGFSGVEDKISYKMQWRIAKNVNGIIVHDYELKEHLYDFGVNEFVLPLRIEIKRFIPNYPKKTSKVLIVHSPSNRETKGTLFLIEAIDQLSKNYEIDFRLVEGLSNEKAKEIYEKADIIVDQLLIGTYGMFAIESMAYGKPTVCYIREDLINSFPEPPPICNANINNIKEKLEELIIDFDFRYQMGIKGRKYIEKYHDSNLLANKAVEIYNS